MIEANCSRKQTVQVWCSTVEIKIITKQIKTTRSNKTIWKVLARHENQTVEYFRQLTLVICKKCSRILIIVARLIISALFSQTKGLSSSLLLRQTKNIVFVMWPTIGTHDPVYGLNFAFALCWVPVNYARFHACAGHQLTVHFLHNIPKNVFQDMHVLFVIYEWTRKNIHIS